MSETTKFYNRITTSQVTETRRQQIKSLQDEFMTFSWRGYDAFENFGAFIINESKGSLKFYNGPSFSNEYTKPQFQSNGGLLQGVNFNKQNISFSIGVYWISIEDYRLMMDWLNPLEVNILSFGFDSKFGYTAKLASIGDSTRWIVGRENGEPRYYTELKLTFDVQNENCARGLHPYEFSWEGIEKEVDLSIGEYTQQAILKANDKKTYIRSDLDTPLIIGFELDPKTLSSSDTNFFDYSTSNLIIQSGASIEDNNWIIVGEMNSNNLNVFSNIYSDDSDTEIDVSLVALYTRDSDEVEEEFDEKVELCSFTLQNITLFKEYSPYKYKFRYNSETGLVYLQYGNLPEKLLSLQTRTDNGEFLIKSLNSSKFMLPGRFSFPDFKEENFKLQLRWVQRIYDKENEIWNIKSFTKGVKQTQTNIQCFPRTNVI